MLMYYISYRNHVTSSQTQWNRKYFMRAMSKFNKLFITYMYLLNVTEFTTIQINPTQYPVSIVVDYSYKKHYNPHVGT